MDYKFLVLVGGISLALVCLRIVSDWIDLSPRRRLVTGVLMVMGAAFAFKSLFPEIVGRLVG